MPMISRGNPRENREISGRRPIINRGSFGGSPIANRGNSRERPEKPSTPNDRENQGLIKKPWVELLMSKKEAKKSLEKENKSKETAEKQSAFGKKSSMDRQEFRSWLRKQPEFKKDSLKHYPNLSEDKRIQEIEKNIWGSVGGKWGSLIEKGTKEPERRKFEYERELHTSKVMNDIKQKDRKKFEAGFIDKFIEKKK
jgi:hypothetical protein